MIHYVRVAVALSRPPKIDEWRRYCVVAATRHEAELVAQQIAACTSVMPVESHWESSHRAGPVQPFGALGCMCWLVEWSDDIGDGDDGWQIDGRCPYHAEDTAAWDALGTATESAECPPGVHSMFDLCPGDCNEPVPDEECTGCGVRQDFLGRCADCEDPPTPETANAGGPDTDDTPSICEDGSCAGRPHYATGAIVPDELKRRLNVIGETTPVCPPVPLKKRRVDTVKVSLPPALDVPHICETSRCWQECRNRTEAAKPSTGDTGVLNCAVCDDWSHALGYTTEDSTKAFLALHAHRNAITESGLTECRSLSQQPTTTRWWHRKWAGLLSRLGLPRGRTYTATPD